MAIIKEIDNVLAISKEPISHKGTLLSYLMENHPQGFNQPVDVFKNDVLLEVDDFDCKLSDDDVILIVFKPAWEIAAQVVIAALVSTAIAYIFAEDPPSMPQIGASDYRSVKNPQSIYSLNTNQNQFGAGQTIPIIYGTVKTTPSLIAPPYRMYDKNEEFLYQLMCLGAGTFDIDDILVSDTSSEDINTESFEYKIITQSDLVGTTITDFIEFTTGDVNYTELVNTVKIVENLEMRGTPASSTMLFYLTGSTIYFGAYGGEYPDLTSLQNGSEIQLSSTKYPANTGTYLVDTVDNINHTVTVQSFTFTNEPDELNNVSNASILAIRPNRIEFFDPNYPSPALIVGQIYDITIDSIDFIATCTGVSTSSGFELYASFDVNFSSVLGTGKTVTIGKKYTTGSAIFETTYGSYAIAEGDKLQGLKSVELDFDMPRGLYNSSGGAFADRTVDGTAYFDAYYSNGTKDTFDYVFSYTDDDNSPIRKTFKPDVIANILPTHTRLALRIKRDSAEPADTSSQDKIHLQRVKGLYKNDYGNQDFGNVTLLWTRIKATNAISAIGQHSIHAWVTRNDVGNTVKDVITDIVTNTDYGAGLSETLLSLPETTETINGAFESEVTTAEALRVAGNAGRYEVKQDGDLIKITKDDVQTLPVCIFNETNIIKDSLTATYSLGKVKEIDGYRVLYRDPDTFQEKEALYPVTSSRPEIVELWGVTDSTIALAEATYLWKKYIYKRNQVEFQTDYQGYIPAYNDKVIVSHSLFKNSQASEVVSESIPVSGSRELVLADTVDGTPNQIIVRGDKGQPETYAITAIVDDTITVTMDDAIVLYTDFTRERTKLSIGTASNMDKEYTITSIKPSKENRMTISAVNYDTRVYE